MLFLGIDLGSSSVKVSVFDGDSGRCVRSAQHPEHELEILSPQPGWAEQDPNTWWHCVQQACAKVFEHVDPQKINAVGIAYQMHGLVLVDQQQQVLRPAIIWCDSRAVEYGEQAAQELGEQYCFEHLLNSPGNFTAAKLRWVQRNEPDIFERIDKLMLPGDFIAMKLSGEINSTATGLSEGTLWDYQQRRPANELLKHWDIDTSLLPELVPSIGKQSQVCEAAAKQLGLKAGTAISYRAGDQANNAFSLNVLQAGEIAATAGTSGVIYGVSDRPLSDTHSRVNTFLHCNDSAAAPRNGVLVCVNGTGRSFSWLRQTLGEAMPGTKITYPALNHLAAQVNIGSDGLLFQPFGNGAERILQNRNPGARLINLDLNRHQLGHWVRATQEGIVFALNMGFEVLKSLGGSCDVIRAGKSNMFLSDIFTQAFANTTGAAVELYDTDGAEGAARGAAIGSGFYASDKEAFAGLQVLSTVEPEPQLTQRYASTYAEWRKHLST
ncbi:MAG: carbohydrate kinase [Cellvibrionaceae bacterium]|nr:carbohydrate kinase [Cellvibrionaceae bacterium]